MSSAVALDSQEQARNQKISEALERYNGLIWKNCKRFGSRWAEDAYQQMVTKALGREDLLEKDVDDLGRKLCYMALTEAAHMARSQKRRDAAIETMKTSSAKAESFEEPLLSLDAWLEVISRISDEKALVFSLSKQGFGEGEIESIAGVAHQRVKRVVRDVNSAIGDVMMHQDAGICDKQVRLLEAYAHDTRVGRGEEKKLDRRVRSKLRAHMEICDVCTAYIEKARGEVGTVLVAALPAQLLFGGRVGSGRLSGAIHSVTDLATGSADKLKLVMHGILGRTEPVGQAATGASASGLGPGRIAAACSAAAACIVVGAVQGVPDVKHVFTNTKAANIDTKPKRVKHPTNIGPSYQGSQKPDSQALPTKSYARPQSSAEKRDNKTDKQAAGRSNETAAPTGQAAGPESSGSQAEPPAESDGDAEFSPDSLGAQPEPGG